MTSLIELDTALRAEADELVSRSGLGALLRGYGTVHVHGSYALQLMTWRDLDIYLEAPGTAVTQFFDLGTRIAELLDPRKMSFINNRSRHDPQCPPGLYWGIRLGDVRQGAWKIDLWAMDRAQCRQALKSIEKIAVRMTPKARQTILALKAELWHHPAYRDTITAKSIYDAVLDDGVRDLDAFWAWVKARYGVQ